MEDLKLTIYIKVILIFLCSISVVNYVQIQNYIQAIIFLMIGFSEIIQLIEVFEIDE
jgi:hypothetical protein